MHPVGAKLSTGIMVDNRAVRSDNGWTHIIFILHLNKRVIITSYVIDRRAQHDGHQLPHCFWPALHSRCWLQISLCSRPSKQNSFLLNQKTVNWCSIICWRTDSGIHTSIFWAFLREHWQHYVEAVIMTRPHSFCSDVWRVR